MRADAPPATVVLFTVGRSEDADRVALQKFDVERIRVVNVGERRDNIGILTMDARRDYERPEMLQVAATIRNFGPQSTSVDAVLYVDGTHVDIQTVRLSGTKSTGNEQPGGDSSATLGASALVVFDDIEFEGGGLIEVVLHVDDALEADNRAWTIIDPPRHIRVLLVTEGNMFLEDALSALPMDSVTMTAQEYESADDKELLDGERSAFDVVIFDGHSTARLPQGNYFFWGAVPRIEGVSAGSLIDDQVIFNWDDTHPILRYVAVETINVYEWLALKLPPEAVVLIEGETSPVMSYLTRDASQFLICAFRLISTDEQGRAMFNTYWGTSVDFLVFMQNAVQYLAFNVATSGKKSVSPGQPVTLPIPKHTERVKIIRPDKREDWVPSAGFQTIHYADTRQVGVYKIEPGVPGHDAFAVNLFNAVESRVEPASTLTIGADAIEAQAATVQVNQPAWKYFLMAMLALLVLEWIVYNQRVFV